MQNFKVCLEGSFGFPSSLLSKQGNQPRSKADFQGLPYQQQHCRVSRPFGMSSIDLSLKITFNASFNRETMRSGTRQVSSKKRPAQRRASREPPASSRKADRRTATVRLESIKSQRSGPMQKIALTIGYDLW